MLADIVRATTDDGVSLDGAYFPAQRQQSEGVDALLWFHADTASFSRPLYLELGQRLSAVGVSFLTANRRGHDFVASGVRGGSLGGLAFEEVSESIADAEAWLSVLRSRGHERLVLGGHSGGAIRVVYAQATSPFPDVAAVIACSPPEYDHENMINRYGDAFTSAFNEASQAVQDGRGEEIIQPGVPIPVWYSHRVYLDTFNAEGRYSFSSRVRELDRPALAIFATQDHPLSHDAQDRLPNQLPVLTTRVIEGANHSYNGRVAELSAVIVEWLDSIG